MVYYLTFGTFPFFSFLTTARISTFVMLSMTMGQSGPGGMSQGSLDSLVLHRSGQFSTSSKCSSQLFSSSPTDFNSFPSLFLTGLSLFINLPLSVLEML